MAIPPWLQSRPVYGTNANPLNSAIGINNANPLSDFKSQLPAHVSMPGPGIQPPAPHQNPRPTVPKNVPKNSKPPKSSIPKQHHLSALEKWLSGDTTYQQQLSEFNQSRSNYNSEYNKEVSQANRDYAETQRELNLQGQRDRMDQQNDFAGRGILHSGVFAKALSDYNTQFNTKRQNLAIGKTDRLGDLSDQRNQFLNQLRLQLDAAKQDAIRRRTEQLGI